MTPPVMDTVPDTAPDTVLDLRAAGVRDQATVPTKS